jgi:hypothetical protein
MQDQIKKLAIMGAGHLLLKRFLAVGAVACVLASLPVMADPIFPSDGQHPDAAGAAELLEAVCPGHVDGFSCRDWCPESATFHLQLEVNAVTRGHFLAPSSEDAVLSTGGCESVFEFGGTILLTRRSRRWKMLWYQEGILTSQCRKVPLRDRREILVCISGYYFHGDNGTALFTEAHHECSTNVAINVPWYKGNGRRAKRHQQPPRPG